MTYIFRFRPDRIPADFLVIGHKQTTMTDEPIHEETSEGIQAVLQELEELADKLRYKVDYVMPPRTNLHIYFTGKMLAYDAAVKAVRELQNNIRGR